MNNRGAVFKVQSTNETIEHYVCMSTSFSLDTDSLDKNLKQNKAQLIPDQEVWTVDMPNLCK